MFPEIFVFFFFGNERAPRKYTKASRHNVEPLSVSQICCRIIHKTKIMVKRKCCGLVVNNARVLWLCTAHTHTHARVRNQNSWRKSHSDKISPKIETHKRQRYLNLEHDLSKETIPICICILDAVHKIRINCMCWLP